MAKSTIKIIEKDGFCYHQHETGIDNGKTRIGVVDVLYPKSLEILANAIKVGLETEANALVCYHAGLTVQLQRQARAAKTGGKMPKADHDRIWNALDKEFKIANLSNLAIIEAKVAEVYADEHDGT